MDITNLSATDIAVYGIVAALLPGLVAVFNRPHFPAWLKQIIMFVVALAAGFVAYVLKNGLGALTNHAELATALGGVWLAAQAAYLVFWKQGLGPAIESNINGGKSASAGADSAPLETDVINEAVPAAPVEDTSYTDPIPEGTDLGPAAKETTPNA